MKVVFVTHLNSEKLKTHHRDMYQQYEILRNNFGEVVFVDNALKVLFDLSKLPAFYYKIIRKKNYNRINQKWIFKSIAKRNSLLIEKIKPDLIFARGSLDLAYLVSDAPKIVWTDATFNNLLNYYDSYKNLPVSNIRSSFILDETGLKNADRIYFTSSWAKNDAMKLYNIKENKICILPFGAVNDGTFSDEEIYKRIENRNLNKPVFTFIGVDWQRKGGKLIFEIMNIFKENNIDFHLNIIGTIADVPENLKENVTLHGFLRKSFVDEKNKIDNLLLNSTFFIMPSNAEALGIVYSEANALGLPAIAYDSGGVSEIVKNELNGIILKSKSPQDYFEKINIYLNDKNKYVSLCKDSLKYFHENLSLDVIGKKFIQDIQVNLKYTKS